MIAWSPADTVYVLKESYQCFLAKMEDDRSRFIERALFAALPEVRQLATAFLNPTLPLKIIAHRDKDALVLSCGALFYGRALARFVMKTDVQQLRELLGAQRRDWAIKTANALQLPTMPLQEMEAERFIARGQSILLAACDASTPLLHNTLLHQLDILADNALPSTNTTLAATIAAAALALSVEE